MAGIKCEFCAAVLTFDGNHGVPAGVGVVAGVAAGAICISVWRRAGIFNDVFDARTSAVAKKRSDASVVPPQTQFTQSGYG